MEKRYPLAFKAVLIIGRHFHPPLLFLLSLSGGGGTLSFDSWENATSASGQRVLGQSHLATTFPKRTPLFRPVFSALHLQTYYRSSSCIVYPAATRGHLLAMQLYLSYHHMMTSLSGIPLASLLYKYDPSSFILHVFVPHLKLLDFTHLCLSLLFLRRINHQIMSFEISTHVEQSDIKEMNHLVWYSFSSVPGDIVEVMYPGGFTPEIQAFFYDTTLPTLSDKSVAYVVVRDSQSKALVSVARWHLQTKDKSLQDIQDEDVAARQKRDGQDPVSGANLSAINDFRDAQAKGKRDTLQGRAHVKLGSLVTHPDYRGRGAGTLALNWGLQKADELGVPTYLEATDKGRPLYLKHGFKDVCMTSLLFL